MNKAQLNVLVLGVGGNVSQGILKALALSALPCRVVGACVSPLSLGLYTVDRAYVSPRADDPGFLDWLVRTCRAEQINAILSGVEPVLKVLAAGREEIEERAGAVPVVSDTWALNVGGDKLDTCRWLEERGFNFPGYASSEDVEGITRLVADCGLPLIAKPRGGKGAQGIFLVRGDADIERASRLKDYVVQEYLGDAGSEYTAGCFCDRDGRVRGTIVMRRELLEGTTFRAEAGEFADVRAEAERIVAALRPVGPCNVQMRVAGGRPVCFEVNVRFSGTTPMRARLGFNEVEAALRHYVMGEEAYDLPLVTEGVVLRYWNEMYVDPRARDALAQTGRLEAPKGYPVLVEDYGTDG